MRTAFWLYSWSMLFALPAYAITAIALALFVNASWKIFSLLKSGQPDPTRSGNRAQRLRNMTREVLGHTKMLRFTATGIAHWFVMIGFGALLGTLITAYGQVINPKFFLPLIGHFVPYLVFTEAIAWLTGIGIVTLIGIRQFTRLTRKDRSGKQSRFYGSSSWKAYYVEATVLVIVFCVIALRGLEGAIENQTAWSWQYALSYPVVEIFNGLSIASIETAIKLVALIKILVSMAWFIVIALNLNMGIAWHRFLAFFNIYFKRNADGKNSLGELPEMLSKGKPVDFEDPAEDDIFGIGKSADISWKGLLDMASCTECGRCQSQCPAWHTDKPLSPKLLIMAMRDHALGNIGSEDPIVSENGPITPDVLWSCTSCGACVNECPVDIEHVDHIINMRRYQVLVESEFPAELANTFKNLEKAGNPWGANRNDRNAWIAECDFPIRIVEGELPEDVEYLFWVGCAGA